MQHWVMAKPTASEPEQRIGSCKYGLLTNIQADPPRWYCNKHLTLTYQYTSTGMYSLHTVHPNGTALGCFLQFNRQPTQLA